MHVNIVYHQRNKIKFNIAALLCMAQKVIQAVSDPL